MVLTFLFIAVIPNFVTCTTNSAARCPRRQESSSPSSSAFPFIAIGLVAGIAGIWLLDRLWTATPQGAIARDKALLTVPVFGHFRRASAAASTARMLSILISSGATVPKALAVAGSSVDDRHFASVLARANQAVKEGKPLGKALAEIGLFRPMALKMIEAGEASASLDKMLAAVAAQQDEELSNSLGRLTEHDGARGAA